MCTSLAPEFGILSRVAAAAARAQLLRLVCYQLANMDTFTNAVQAEYEARATPGAGEGEMNDRQKALLTEVYEALAPPLDERFAMLHPGALRQKPDDAASGHFGLRGRWRGAADD